MFIGLCMFFLGLAEAYKRHHNRLMLREGLMVAFFLAGLVVPGGHSFDEHSINPLGLFLAALPPTMIAVFCFRTLPKAAVEMFDYQSWAQWFQSLDRVFVFLLILPFVVVIVALWSDFSRARKHTRASHG